MANDKNENDVDYLIDRAVYFENLFHSFFVKYNINQISKEPIINDSTFIETPEWIKNKKCIINPQNNDNKCFQCSVTVSLYHKQITGRNFFRVSQMKPFIENIDWENTNFPPQKQDYKTSEVNHKSIALNVLRIYNNEKIG